MQNNSKAGKEKGIDWTKKDLYEAIGRPDLKPKPKNKHECSFNNPRHICECYLAGKAQAKQETLEAIRVWGGYHGIYENQCDELIETLNNL